MELKAIPTHYDGHHFRSRLEARWAVFFNHLEIPYEYEREGYDLDGVRYLPDFWLPDQQSFVEVKGELPTEVDQKKARLLALASGKPVYIFIGEIFPYDETNPRCTDILGWRTREQFRIPLIIRWPVEADVVCSITYNWCECPYCGMLDVAYEGDVEDLPCGCLKKRLEGNPLLEGIKDDFDTYYQKGGDCEPWYAERLSALHYTANSPRLTAAFNAARRARFEFGQSGA